MTRTPRAHRYDNDPAALTRPDILTPLNNEQTVAYPSLSPSSRTRLKRAPAASESGRTSEPPRERVSTIAPPRERVSTIAPPRERVSTIAPPLPEATPKSRVFLLGAVTALAAAGIGISLGNGSLVRAFERPPSSTAKARPASVVEQVPVSAPVPVAPKPAARAPQATPSPTPPSAAAPDAPQVQVVRFADLPAAEQAAPTVVTKPAVRSRRR